MLRHVQRTKTEAIEKLSAEVESRINLQVGEGSLFFWARKIYTKKIQGNIRIHWGTILSSSADKLVFHLLT